MSVVVPAYNCAEFIETALWSVFAQTFTDYEVIVVNDGSPDTRELERVLVPYLDRIVYIEQDNRGLAGARNAAVRAARGTFVAFLDADDAWEPDYLAVQVGILRADPTADVVYPDAVIVGNGEDSGRRLMELSPSDGEVTFERLVLQQCNVLVHATARREAIVRAGMFDESLRRSEDFDLWLRIVKQGGRIVYHRRPLVRYHRRPGSLSSDPARMCAASLAVLEKAERTQSLSASERRALEEGRLRFAAWHRYYQGMQALSARDGRTACEHLRAANAYVRSRKLALATLGLGLAPRSAVTAYNLFDGARRALGGNGTRMTRSTSATREPSEGSGALAVRAACLMAAKTLAFAVGFALPLLLVRLLSVGEFGLYKQVFLIVNTAVSFLPLGFAMSAFYFWPREPGRRDAIVFNILLFHLVVTGAAALLLMCWPGLLAEIFHGPELVAYGGGLALVVLLWGASSFLEIMAIANGETRVAAVLIVALQLTKVLALLGAALWAPTVGALIAAAVAQGALQIGVALVYLGSRFGRFWGRFDGALLRAQLSYALPHGMAAWLYWVHMDLHHYFVAHRFDAAAYAIYAVGCFQLPLLGILCESVGSVAIPRVNRLQSEGREGEIRTLAADLVRQLAAILVPLYVLFIIVRRELIAVLFTNDYVASAPIFAVNLTLMPLAVVATVGDVVIRAYAGSRFFLIKLRLVLTALTLVGLSLATERFGLLGPIAVVVAVAFLDRAAVAVKVARLLGLRWSDHALFGDLPKIALASAAAGLAALMLRAVVPEGRALLVLLLCGLSFAAAYLALLRVMGVPRTKEREAARRLQGLHDPAA